MPRTLSRWGTIQTEKTVDRSAPFSFTKSPLHVVESGTVLPYPPGTADYHHEMELAVAIGTAGFQVSGEAALQMIFGYATALDMTRRDLQAAAKEKRRPWDIAKDFEGAAVVGSISRPRAFPASLTRGSGCRSMGSPVKMREPRT